MNISIYECINTFREAFATPFATPSAQSLVMPSLKRSAGAGCADFVMRLRKALWKTLRKALRMVLRTHTVIINSLTYIYIIIHGIYNHI